MDRLLVPTDVLRIFNASAHLGRIIGPRKCILSSSQYTFASMEYLQLFSEFCAMKSSESVTFGRNPGCSNMTELLRNF